MRTALGSLLAIGLFLGGAADRADAGGLKVGLFKGRRADAIEEIAKTLAEEGMQPHFFSPKDLAEGRIYAYDVLFFGGGWKVSNWTSLAGRMHLVEYVQGRGCGVVFSAFRCGCSARTSIRTIFPEIGEGENKVNASGMIIRDKAHPVTEGLPGRFAHPYWDHTVMKVGPDGQVLATDGDGNVTILCGAVGKGRVVYIGPFLGLDWRGKGIHPMDPNDRRLLLNSIQWVGAAGGKAAGGSPKTSDGVRLKVLRRERIWDWTHDEKGFDRKSGILPQSYYPIELELGDLLIRTRRLFPFAGDAGTSERLLELHEAVVALREELDLNYDQAKRKATARIAEMSLKELVAGKTAWDGSLLFSHQIEPVRKAVAQMERGLERRAEAVRARRAAQEIAGDSKLVPKLIEELEAADAATREHGALELGRIGDKRSVLPLIHRLTDKEYPVRRNAIFALGWMQAKEAVPALLQIAEKSSDVQTKRRAIQALGLIGDGRAADLLTREVRSPDVYARQNAMLSLGWIGDQRAIGPLCRMVREGTEGGWTREDIACAIRSLGHIGDKSAIEILEQAKERHPEKQRGRNFYRTYLAIPEAAEIAIREIENGGRKQQGVIQPELLRQRDNFYWLRGRYNAFYGRFFRYGGKRTPEEIESISRYAKASGITGFIAINQTDRLLEAYPGLRQRYPAFFSREGLKLISYWRRRGTSVLDKAGFEYDVERWGKYPCLGGFWSEEALSWASELGDEEVFRQFLLEKYTGKELSDFGCPSVEQIKVPELNDEGRKSKFLWAEYMEFVSEKGIEAWREAREWLLALRKGTELLYSLSARYTSGGSTYISGYPRVNQVLGANGPQSYGAHSFDNCFNLEMTIDGETRPALGEWYCHQSDCVGRVERGFAASFLHGQCFFEMGWPQIYKHPRTLLICWEKGRAEAAARQFRKGRAIANHIVQGERPKIVAQIYSGRTSTLTYAKGGPDWWGGRCYPYTQNQEGIWEALLQSHLPVDLLWAETTDKEKMAKYRVIILSDARCLSGQEVSNLRDWVKQGGILFATGGTSLHDQWDRPAKNYLLSDVFGADCAESKVSDDVFRHLQRDLKPEKGIGKIKITDATYMRCMEGKQEVEYELRQGFDSIDLTTGRAVGVWPDGDPAVVENKFGEGKCILIAATWPGLSHTGRATTVDPLYRDFWEGARELISGCVSRGLEMAGVVLPLQVENCPKQVEVGLRIQAEKRRWVVQLLNYDPGIAVVKDVVVKVRPPSLERMRVHYPYPAREHVAYETEDEEIRFTVRDFDIHEIVVIECGNPFFR